MKTMNYAVVIEKAGTGYSAYVPDLPGCISVGDTLKEIQDSIREAIAGHVEEMRRNGEAIPMPTTHVSYANVA